MFTKILLLLALTIASAQAQSNPAYLDQFNYHITELRSMEEATALFNEMNRDFKGKSICANRAHVWSYDLNRFHNVKVGKVFLFYTPYFVSNTEKTWWYHVAPYVIVNGQEIVLDRVFARGPKTLIQWENSLSTTPGRKNCKVLDPRHDASDYQLLSYIKAGRQMPGSEANPCYVRKAPMYWIYPGTVANTDMDPTNPRQYYVDFNKADMISVCKQAISTGSLNRKKWCERYFGYTEEEALGIR